VSKLYEWREHLARCCSQISEESKLRSNPISAGRRNPYGICCLAVDYDSNSKKNLTFLVLGCPPDSGKKQATSLLSGKSDRSRVPGGGCPGLLSSLPPAVARPPLRVFGVVAVSFPNFPPSPVSFRIFPCLFRQHRCTIVPLEYELGNGVMMFTFE
jgi:hypothetical protein